MFVALYIYYYAHLCMHAVCVQVKEFLLGIINAAREEKEGAAGDKKIEAGAAAAGGGGGGKKKLGRVPGVGKPSNSEL